MASATPVEESADAPVRAGRSLEQLRGLVGAVSPLVMAHERVIPVLDELVPLLPEGGLRRGSTIALRGDGACSLAVALATRTSQMGGWVVGLGLPDLGLTAALEAGAALERWAFVDHPGDRAAEVLNALTAGVDLVITGPRVTMGSAHARRMTARLRERGTSVMGIDPGPGAGPRPDLTLEVTASRWTGIEWGHGRLRARRVEVVSSGRGAAARPRRLSVWLPGPHGKIEVIERVGFVTPSSGGSVEMVRDAGVLSPIRCAG